MSWLPPGRHRSVQPVASEGRIATISATSRPIASRTGVWLTFNDRANGRFTNRAPARNSPSPPSPSTRRTPGRSTCWACDISCYINCHNTRQAGSFKGEPRPKPDPSRFSPFVGNERGGQTAAILSSITSTCRRHGIDPQVYLAQLLANLPSAPISQLDQWLADTWKQRQDPQLIADAHARP
ncbi:MAG TPA: transposase domain-containing protein [Tepidisphaeraceae bacterium]